jgi:hypothetical protein
MLLQGASGTTQALVRGTSKSELGVLHVVFRHNPWNNVGSAGKWQDLKQRHLEFASLAAQAWLVGHDSLLKRCAGPESSIAMDRCNCGGGRSCSMATRRRDSRASLRHLAQTVQTIVSIKMYIILSW